MYERHHKYRRYHSDYRVFYIEYRNFINLHLPPAYFFVFDVLTKSIDYPQLLYILNSITNVPVHTYVFRALNLFKNVLHRTNYGSFEPINSASKLFKKVIDLFVDGNSRESFRIQVKALSKV